MKFKSEFAFTMLALLAPLTMGTTMVALVFVFAFLAYDLMKRAREYLGRKTPKITELPIITPTGQIVNSIEDLDMHLDFLKSQLEEKEKEAKTAKSKIVSTEENLKRLTDTTNEVRKYYLKLKSEISKTEGECKEMKNQIEDYKCRQIRLREEVNNNVKYYTDLLSNIDNCATDEDYEVVPKLPFKSNSNAFNEKFGIL